MLAVGTIPTAYGAQADGCSPVAKAYADGVDVCKLEIEIDDDETELEIELKW